MSNQCTSGAALDSGETCVPVIKMDNKNLAEVAEILRSTCQNEGFFYLESHGVSRNLIGRVMEQSKKLFSLPIKSKERIRNAAMSRGYTAMEEETLDPTVQRKGDTKEGVSCLNKAYFPTIFCRSLTITTSSILVRTFPKMIVDTTLAN